MSRFSYICVIPQWFLASVSIYKAIHTLFFPTNTHNCAAGSSDSNMVFTELTELPSVANEHNRSPKIANSIPKTTYRCLLCCNWGKYHTLILSKCQILKTTFRLRNAAPPSEPAPALWQMRLDEQAAFDAFFFSFCRVRRFCLTLQICPAQMKDYVKKKRKTKKTRLDFLKAAC